ncbi:MAG: hypothetical protein ACFB10_26665 [Salibacteraceae bacterium]
MKKRFRIELLRLHFTALAIAVLNSISKYAIAYSLESRMEMGIQLLTALSGLALFFFYLKPFRRKLLYFSIYALTGFLFSIGLIFRGVFWGMVLSVLLFPVMPNTTRFEKDGIIISTPYRGFLAACCIYQVKERHLLIFERHYDVWYSQGPIDMALVNVRSDRNSIEVTYPSHDQEGVFLSKTIKK